MWLSFELGGHIEFRTVSEEIRSREHCFKDDASLPLTTETKLLALLYWRLYG